jgi:hypothetical protein
MLWPLYPSGKNPWYPLNSRLGGPQSWSECCGVALQFLKDVMEPRETAGNIPAPEEHEDYDDSTAGTQSQEAGPSTVEERLSVDPDLDTISTHSEIAEKSFCRKRKRGNTKYNHQQEMLNLEREKFEWIRQQEDRQDDDDDLLFLKSLLPCMKRMPLSKKLIFRSQILNLLASEMSALDRRETPSTSSSSSVLDENVVQYDTLV